MPSRALKKCSRAAARETAANDDGKRQSPTQRLGHILDEIERRDIELKRAFQEIEAARATAEASQRREIAIPGDDESRAAHAAQRHYRLRRNADGERR
jgi:hypothetical protein